MPQKFSAIQNRNKSASAVEMFQKDLLQFKEVHSCDGVQARQLVIAKHEFVGLTCIPDSFDFGYTSLQNLLISILFVQTTSLLCQLCWTLHQYFLVNVFQSYQQNLTLTLNFPVVPLCTFPRHMQLVDGLFQLLCQLTPKQQYAQMGCAEKPQKQNKNSGMEQYNI